MRILSDFWVANLSMRCFEGDWSSAPILSITLCLSIPTPPKQKLAVMLAANQETRSCRTAMHA